MSRELMIVFFTIWLILPISKIEAEDNVMDLTNMPASSISMEIHTKSIDSTTISQWNHGIAANSYNFVLILFLSLLLFV
ncbi:unnamed protein product [Rotaria socialis]